MVCWYISKVNLQSAFARYGGSVNIEIAIGINLFFEPFGNFFGIVLIIASQVCSGRLHITDTTKIDAYPSIISDAFIISNPCVDKLGPRIRGLSIDADVVASTHVFFSDLDERIKG